MREREPEQGEIEASNVAPLPIPQATLKRDLRIQTAARQYIHGGQTNITELARKLDLARTHLSTVCSEDDWQGFAARYQTLTNSGNHVWSLLGRRTGEELASIAEEREERRLELAQARAQRAEVLAQLASDGSGELPPCPLATTMEHARLVSTLRGLTLLCAELSGLADLEREQQDKRRAAIGIEAQVLKMQAQAPKTPDPSDSARPAAGTVIDFGA